MEIEQRRSPIVRRSERHVPLLDEPKIGHLQAVILKRFEDLGSEAYGYNILQQLTLEYGVWIDPAQIYGAIRRLVDLDFIEHVETRKQEGAPPLKIYKLTAAGRAALKSATAHYLAVADFLQKQRKATRK